jgi:hypothetical protein
MLARLCSQGKSREKRIVTCPVVEVVVVVVANFGGRDYRGIPCEVRLEDGPG